VRRRNPVPTISTTTFRSRQDVNIGVIGFGRHSSAKLYPAFLLAGAEIGCVLTRSLASAQKAAAKLGADRHYDDIDGMLESEQLDAVVICVEPEDQASLTIRCLQAGVAVFVEKPLGMSADDARKVAAASEKHDVPVMVGFMKRFAPCYQRLAELVADQDQFGRVLTIDASFSFAPWTTELRVTSFLQQGAIHMLDILVATFGNAAVEAGHSNSTESDIGLAYTLRFADGSIASLTLSATQARASTFETILVTGTKGWAEADNLGSVNYRLDNQDGAIREKWDAHLNVPGNTEQERELCKEGFYGEAQHFMERVAANEMPKSSAAENVATMELCDAMIEIVL
jgi:UDP-N-acetylglucosamine 3-dehydrogenase